MLRKFNVFDKELETLPNDQKLLIGTINAFSYNVSLKDNRFNNALLNCDVLIPDGIGVVMALRLLDGKSLKKIAGADLFYYEMNRINEAGGKCMFLGSSENVLKQIQFKAMNEFPNVKIKTFSPPFKSSFSEEENQQMIHEVNEFAPDVLFVGMTAPKQEKWAFQQFDFLNAGHICCIGAVFDFYAGTVKRAPRWMIAIGMEWLYRLIKEPKRMWRRYLIGNIYFTYNIFIEKLLTKRVNI